MHVLGIGKSVLLEKIAHKTVETTLIGPLNGFYRRNSEAK